MRRIDLATFLGATEKFNRTHNTIEKARYYLVYELKTHNEDGTLTENHGGEHTNKWRNKPDFKELL